MTTAHQEQHEIISLLRELALELGRSPITNDLIQNSKLSKYRVNRAFGSFSVAMRAAGLEMVKNPPRRKISNEIFERSLEPHLEDQCARQAEPRCSNFILPIEDYPTTVIFGDMH